MERQTKAQAMRIGERVDGIDVGLRLARRGEGATASLARVRHAFSEREDREQSVADEFQDLAAVSDNCRHLAIEITVKQI